MVYWQMIIYFVIGYSLMVVLVMELSYQWAISVDCLSMLQLTHLKVAQPKLEAFGFKSAKA